MANIGKRVRRRRWEPIPDTPAPSPQKEPQPEEKRPSRKKAPVRENVREKAEAPA